MQTVGELLGYTKEKVLTGPRLGIEIEVEGMHRTVRDRAEYGEGLPIGSTWKVISDGSLRNDGVEIVTKKSIHVNELDKALAHISDVFSLEGNRPTFSVRTSTHVHLNVQDMSIAQVIVLVALAGAWEPITQRYIKESRRTNLFCVPLHSCAGYQRQLRRAYHTRNTQIALDHASNIGKYSSINLGRLNSLGTVEFRAMHGAESLEHLANWCRMLVRIKELVHKFSAVDDAFDVLSQDEEEIKKYLTEGLALTEFPGDVCSGYHEACAASMALLSGIKYQSKADAIDRVWYAEDGSAAPLEALAASYYGKVNKLMSVEAQSFKAYKRPSWELVYRVLEEAPVGTGMYDVYRVAEDTVVFFAYANNGTRYVLLYRGQDKVPQPKKVTLRYALGGV